MIRCKSAWRMVVHMNTQGERNSTRRPTSVTQRLVSTGLAAGMFFGVGGLIAIKTLDAAANASLAAAAASNAA